MAKHFIEPNRATAYVSPGKMGEKSIKRGKDVSSEKGHER